MYLSMEILVINFTLFSKDEWVFWFPIKIESKNVERENKGTFWKGKNLKIQKLAQKEIQSIQTDITHPHSLKVKKKDTKILRKLCNLMMVLILVNLL